MKVLIVDTDCVGLAFAWRCAQAGHAVRWFVQKKDGNHPQTGMGFKGVEKVENWVSHVKWADLIFPTSNDEYMERLQFFRRQGFTVFGPSVESAALEVKRAEGMKFLERHDIEVPPYKTFKTLKDAEEYQWNSDARHVFKTMGDNEDKSLSYCAKSPADMVARLQRWQKLGMNPKGEVMLQTFIPGIEFAVSRWMGTGGFIGQYNENFEHKKMCAGEHGPNTGEMGTVQKYCEASKLGLEMLKPLENDLMGLKHLGDVDVNCIVDDQGKAWPLEFTCRPGWPAFNIMLAEHRGDPCQWMRDALDGKDTLDAVLDVAVGVVIAQPDFPYSNMTKAETQDIPLYGVTRKNGKYIQPQAVKFATLPDMDGDKIVERDIWATAGDYLAVVTGTGATVKKARDRAYKTVGELTVSNMIVRDDIGEKLKDKLPELQRHGYATEFEYGEDQ